ncbi:MAG: glycosyltransferase [Vicinamibacterales bacterium]
MARILINTFGSYGDVNPYIGLALELQRRGHEPVLALPAVYREAVEREGLAFRAIRPDLDPDDTALIQRIMDPARGTEAIFGEIVIPNLQATFEDLRPACADADMVITHPAALVGPIVAQVLRRPWASSVLAPMSFFSVSDPVVPPPAPWVHGWLTRSRALSRLFVWLSNQVTRRWARPVQRFRESLGLDAGENPILAGQHSPHLVLALFSRVLAAPQPDWPPNTCLAGPILYNGAGSADVSAEIEAFLAAGDAPVVFTLGSSAVEAAGSFYDISAAAVQRLGRRAVMLVGRHAHNRPRAVDGRILAVDYAPHAALFPRAAAIVHQGGIGTTHQALASGRPMLVVPHAHDQPDNASRVTRLGVARTLYPKRYTPDAVARELGDLLADERRALRAKEVAATVRAETGPATACDAIERIMGRR